MSRSAAAFAAAILLLTGLGVPWPSAAGAQTGSAGSASSARLPPADVLGDCTDAVPVIVASDAAAQSDIYSAVTLAGVLGDNTCIVLAGGRDEPFPQAQLDRLDTAASGGYVVGGPAAVPQAKLGGREMIRVYGADRWATADAVGTVAAALAAGEVPEFSSDTDEGDDDQDNSDTDDQNSDDGSGDGDDRDTDEPAEPTPAWQQRLTTAFSSALRARSAPDDICMSLYRNGEPIFEHKANLPLLPASLMKLATATVALSELGADAAFTTQVVVEADALDAVSDGVLRGDVYLIGGGDPVLATPGYMNRIDDERPFTDVTELADSVMAALTAQGITTIDGAIVGDGSWFADGEQTYTEHFPDDADDDTPPIWKRSYEWQNLVGVLGGLTINDGFSRWTFDRAGHTRSADPAREAASDFDDLLEARGMVIRERPRAGSAPAAADSTDLGSITSPPVSEILVRVLRFSENTVAEMLLKQIGRHHGDSSRAASAAAATASLRNLLGATADEVVLMDGSGLSVHNRMSCEAVVQMLLLVGSESDFVASMSIVGRTRTLRTCPARPAAAGDPINTIYAKGGQLNDSSSLAGVSTADNGDVLTFAMIANEPLIIRLGSCNILRQRTLNAIGQYTYGPTS